MRLLRLLLGVVTILLAVGCGGSGSAPALTVGATGDPQSTLLAHVYAAGLRYYGTAARVDVSDDALGALDGGKVSVTTGFTGRLLRRFDPDSTARSAPQVYRALAGALPEGVVAADYAVAAEDKPALAVTEATADRWDSRALAALVRNCGTVTVGTRTGVPAPESVGECTPPPAREFGSTEMLFDALRSGAVTAAWTSTADTAVPAGVVVLVDRKPALIPAENVVALFRRNELDAMQVRAVNEIAGVLDTAALVEMLRSVRSGADPAGVAEGWLAENPLGR